MSSLIRNDRYLSVTERVGTKSNYRPLLTHLPVTSILHYSVLSPGCRQTLTPTHVQRAFTCISAKHELIINLCINMMQYDGPEVQKVANFSNSFNCCSCGRVLLRFEELDY